MHHAYECMVWDGEGDSSTEVDKINSDLPRFKRIAHVIVREREFEKTTTAKIKRFVDDNKLA